MYVDEEGTLEEVLVKPGDRVTEGQVLARLENSEVDISIAELIGQRDELSAQLDGLRRVSREDDRAGSQIDPVNEALNRVKDQLHKRELDKGKLTLGRAPGRNGFAAAVVRAAKGR